MSTRPKECGYCGHDHPSSESCAVEHCDCNEDEFMDMLDPDAGEEE
jgi:hypothetical protein